MKVSAFKVGLVVVIIGMIWVSVIFNETEKNHEESLLKKSNSIESKLEISGTTTSTAFAGALTGNVTGNLTSSGANTMGTLAMGGTLTTKAILPDTDASYDIGSTLKGFSKIYATATSAEYADLAEIYESDSLYEVGTVVVFGGSNEITTTTPRRWSNWRAETTQV